MTRDRSNIMMRIFTVALLMIFSMGARADVKILYGEKGTEKFEGTGGKIEVTQKESDDKTQVTVYLTVTPDNGYTMAKDGIELYATIPANAGSTRAPEVSEKLTLKCDDFKDNSSARTYYVDIDSNLALWVKNANFQPQKRDGAKSTPDYSGTYYIVSGRNDQYTENSPTTNYYLCPTEGWYFYDGTNSYTETDNGKPFLTTYKCFDGSYDDVSKAVWIIESSTEEGCYYIKQKKTTNDGKYRYLVSNGKIGSSNVRRMRVHLEEVANDEALETLGGKALFEISFHAATSTCPADHLDIIPHSSEGRNGDTEKYLVVNNGNFNKLKADGSKADGPDGTYGQGTGGIIGVYSTEKNEMWYLELFMPEISVDDCRFTLSYPIEDNTVEIRYTTDGTEPTATSTLYDEQQPFTPGLGAVQIKVAAFKKNIPTIKSPTFTYDNFTKLTAPTCELDEANNELTLNTSEDNATIYYKIGGDDPTISNENEYSGPFPVSEGTVVKAFVVKPCSAPSDIITHEVIKVATPTFELLENNKVKITSTTPDATIYYTIGDDLETLEDPNTSSNLYTSPLTVETGKYFKAIAVKAGCFNSSVATTSEAIKLKCAKPTIKRMGKKLKVSCSFPSNEYTIRYTIADNGDTPADPNSSSSICNEPWLIDVSEKTPPITIKAYVSAEGYIDSDNNSFTLSSWGNGSENDPYIISTKEEFDSFVSNVNANANGEASKYYQLIVDVNGGSAITTTFTGSFEGVADDEDGSLPTISGLTHALFNTISGGTVKNIILDNVKITSGTNVGAICNEATGASRIYNCGVLATNSTVEKEEDGYDKITSCSSTITGTGYVGGIVGLLDGSSRVINCFSYAEIKNGSYVGGIVGYNNVATTSSNLNTMVMNCMFYGNITGGTNKAPIYNGTEISNVGETGVGNYNYFLADATFTDGIDTYNCALMAEKRYLQRFEFFRQLLNSHRELAGWWATGTFSKSEMAKWVMEPSQIGSKTPYPVLKAPKDANGNYIQYPSVVNLVKTNLEEFSTNEEIKKTQRNQGRKFGTLTVTIQMDNAGDNNVPYHHPDGASLTETSLSLPITDKDPEHFNFNYYKVQLPYYNDVGTKNYTGNRVVTGWKIVNISGGSTLFKTGSDAETNASGEITKAPYNFADRNCTEKDLYSKSGRVFAQGAYFDVPEGVTSITIQPYWAKCVYLADANADVVYSEDMKTAHPVSNVGGGTGGTIYTDGTSYSIAGENQVVFTSMGNAIATTNSGLFAGINGYSNHTVYDYAVVLVGNYHFYGSLEASTSKPYTVTSIDLDGDNEPDYSYILRFDERKKVHPVRVDFLNVPGLGMAQKSTGSTGTSNFGIMQPVSWFEVTNTALFRVTQMEYDAAAGNDFPIILQGGVIEQWVSGQSTLQNMVKYFHVGGNVWFKEFHLGCHQDKSDKQTKHPPVSVTGGDYGAFYLTGLYATTINYNDNAECYINGGRFGTVAGAGMEGIGNADDHTNGNIVWQINHADIEEFYGGGINAAKPIEGSITTVITGSHVKRFCGGPKFGDLNPNRTVITTATNCTFGSFFGAGYGGNSYNRVAPGNFTGSPNYDWNSWIAGTIKGNVSPEGSSKGDYPGGITYKGYHQDYISNFGGVSTRFDYQFLPQSDNTNNVGRLFIDFVKFSLATTHNVTSTLTGCTITGNFYGGGSLGMVKGDVTSTLTDCTVRGNVFGGGYDATRPKVQVMNTSDTGSIDGFLTPPRYDTNTGAFFPAAEPYNTSIEYTWEHSETVNNTATAIDKTNHILYTTADLTTLGLVTGDVTLYILGNTLVEGLAVDYEGNLTGGDRGGVFGGGDASAVSGNTKVIINATGQKTNDGYTYNTFNVFGGGNAAAVGGNSSVTLKGKTIVDSNVFGGGNMGIVSGSATVKIEE